MFSSHHYHRGDLTGQVVVVTGASAGVGRATARAFAARGCKVALLARGEAGLEAAAADVRRLGGEALVIPLDVSDGKAVDAAAERVEAELGPIAVWVNNAMNSVFAYLWDIEPDEYRRVVEVTFLGQVNGTMAALKRMRARDGGSIVLVGSALAYRGIPLQSAYCGAKHGIEGMFDSLRAELVHDRSAIRLTMVQCPGMNTTQFGWVRNKMGKKPQPVPPIYDPDIAAEAIVWASQHRRREIYVGASTVVAIVGNKLFPSLGDWYLGKTGVDSQFTTERRPAGYRDNLDAPLDADEDRGAHGPFLARQIGFSPETWASTHKGALALAAGAALVAVAVRRARLG